MRDSIIVQAQFSIAASGAETPQDIINALDELERAEGLKIADFINAFCRERGIDPRATELADYYRESTEYKAKKQTEEDKKHKEAAVKNLAERVKEYQDNLVRGVPPARPEMLKTGETISKDAAVLAVDHSLKKIFMSSDDYITKMLDYNFWEEYAPDIFHRLPFPNGTINLIGARSGGGKTTALISIARDIITTTVPQKIESSADRAKERNRRRRAVFISREMTVNDILNRLILSTAWACIKNGEYSHFTKEGLEQLEHPIQTIKETLRERRHNDPQFTPAQGLYNFVWEKYIDPALKSERLLMYNALDEESLENILTNIKIKTEPGDIILVDYVQLLPPSTTNDAEKYATADYLRARYIVTAIKKYASENDVVFICAAQIRSTAAKEQRKGADPTEADFKDSSDFGQAAHSAVIIAREKKPEKGDNKINPKKTRETPELYYTCVKARSSHHLNDEYKIEWVPKYQYMGPGGKRGEQSPGDEPGSEPSGNGDTDDDFVITADMVRSQERGKK
jgi:hypothetical protein